MQYDLSKQEDVLEVCQLISTKCRENYDSIVESFGLKLDDYNIVSVHLNVAYIDFISIISAFLITTVMSSDAKKDIKMKEDLLNTLLNKTKKEVLLNLKSPPHITAITEH